MKKVVFILFLSFFITPCVYAKKDISSLNIVEQIEKNLIYSKDVQKKASGEPIVIQKGGWETKDTKAFEAVEEKKIETSITSSKDDTRIISLKQKAYNAMQVGQTEVAIKLYKQVLRKNKNDNYAKLSLATAYHQLGQYKQAKPLYLELLNKFPKDEQIIANLLAIVIEETPYEAVYLLSALADKNPNSPLIQAQASLAYGNTQKYDEAIKYLKKSIKLDPVNIQYRYNLAVLYDLSSQYNQAYFLYKQVLNEAKINESKMKQIPYQQIQNRIITIEKLI